MMYAQVIVDIASSAVDRVFTYRVPEGLELQRGMRVRVPFGPREKEGYVLGFSDTCDLDESKIKDIGGRLEDYPALLPPLIDLAEEIAGDTHCPLAEALRLMLPAEMRGGRVRVKTETVARLTIAGEALEDAIAACKNARKRRLLLEMLSDGGEHPVSEIAGLVKDARVGLNDLVSRGYAEYLEREVLRSPYPDTVSLSPDPDLTDEQQQALADLLPAVRRGAGAFLLHGVTGSGKSEVFIRAVRECLRLGKTALVLVPEIVLTPQMVTWFRGRFGDVAAVLHSRLSAGERFDEWRRIRRGHARVVIGARSAVFAPLDRLGLIVVDEEHEQSYQSEHFPQYDARHVAESRCKREGAVLVLASATPSILSFARMERGDLTLLEMRHRVHDRPMPAVTVVDMREELRLGNKGVFSGELCQKLDACIRSGRQAMLFINRRGYAQFVNCRACGEPIRCEHCDVSMTYHDTDHSLHCHWCGRVIPMPDACPNCGSAYIRTCGVGTQRVEQEVKRRYPGVGVIRMDVDTTGDKNAYMRLLSAFRAREGQVLVGTQMIAKGLDFPEVTLVGAILADSTLNMPDYRAPERTFQLLTQVAGRAGRAQHPGEVVIQTYMPEHYAIQAAAAQDYRSFYHMEFDRRKKDLYPPFTMMARLLCTASHLEAAQAVSQTLLERLQDFVQEHPRLRRRVLFMRQDDAPLTHLRGMYRAQVLIKLLEHPESREAVEFMQSLASEEWPCDVLLEINPASLA
ncbi:MAG: primosomal protein N' [Clostridia bacterium]|nr:primosomal protein N' [Clostridia bacterium]